MLNKKSQANSNLAALEIIARRLGTLKDEVVFLGGCTTALYITDPAAPDVRFTKDVDCIVDVLSLGEYYKLEKYLELQGFKKAIEDSVICRWYCDDLILDIMPTDTAILGFSNAWYKPAIQHAITYQLADDLPIKILTTPYFLATKFAAFKDRGKGDYLSSHDLEDMITVIDGRIEIANEIRLSDQKLKEHLVAIFNHLLQDKQFHAALPGHLNYGPVTQERTQIIRKRLEQISQIK